MTFTKRYSSNALLAGLACVLCLCWLYLQKGNNLMIHDAIRDGDLQKVRQILAANPEAANEWELVGPPWEPPEKRRMFPLHTAVELEEQDIMELLIQNGADPNALGYGGFTPLHSACNNGQVVFESLIRAGANPNARDDKGRTPLHVAAEFNDDPAVIALLIRHGADVNARDDEGYSPFLFCMSNPYPAASVEIARLLLRHGADPKVTVIDDEVKYGTDKVDALDLAASFGNKAVSDVLLELGFELDLHSAINLARTDDVRRMLKSDPKLVEKTEHADNLLGEVVTMLQYRLLAPVHEPGRYLLEEVKDPALFAKIVEENLDIFDLLFEQNVPMTGSNVALLNAVQMPHHGVAEVLLKNGASIWSMNTASYVLQFALADRTKQLLREYGADESMADQKKIDVTVRGLVKELNRDNVRYRMYAVQTLSMYGPQARLAIPALKEALTDENENVRSMAASALKKIQADR